MSIIAVGDLHLNDSRSWSYEVSKEIVKTIIESEYNIKGNTLVLLGDLTETAFPSGLITDLLLTLFSNLNYNEVYVLVGNHDKKPNKQGRLVLSYKFLQSKSASRLFPRTKITVVDRLLETTIENNNCLFMPYLFSDSEMKWEDYEKVNTDCDILFGHFTDTSIMDLKDRTVNISKIHTKYVCLGHQHNPGLHYVGSVAPNSTSEANRERAFWVFEGDTKKSVALPKICDYYTVKFPDSLPGIDAQFPVWTVENCAFPEIAIEHYGDIYVHKTLYSTAIDTEGLTDLGVLGNKEEFTNKKLFEAWRKEAHYDTSILDLAESYMTTN
jgi:predicted phosphodiesterase